MTSRLRAQGDWAAGVALMGLGAVLVVVGAVAVSGSRYVSDQLAYMVSGGLGGLLLLGAGATLVLTAGLGDEWRKLDRLENALPYPKVPEPSAAVLVRRGRVLAGAGMVVALVFVVLAWVKVSGEADPEPGLEAIGTATIGLMIGALLVGLATLLMKRRISVRKSRLFAPWLQAEAAAPAPVSTNGHVMVASGLTRFHNPGCPALAGLGARAVGRRQIPQGLEPCDLCEAQFSGPMSPASGRRN
ncbi:MAG: hypothetical protein ACRD0C_12025 [Acidimicrobiia bacterium]